MQIKINLPDKLTEKGCLSLFFGFRDRSTRPRINRTYPGKLRNPVYGRYLCVKNNDLL